MIREFALYVDKRAGTYAGMEAYPDIQPDK